MNKPEELQRKVRLTFESKSLLYDIKNYAFVEGEVMNDENEHAKHTLIDIGESGNVDRVRRILAVVYSSVIELLFPYTKQEPLEEEIKDELWAPEDYVIEMTVPGTFSRTTLQLLSKLIHEYMVYMVLHDWLSITNKQAAANWLEKANAVEEQINEVKHLRRFTYQRKCRPFA